MASQRWTTFIVRILFGSFALGLLIKNSWDFLCPNWVFFDPRKVLVASNETFTVLFEMLDFKEVLLFI